MFINVLYGNNVTLTVNTRCKSIVLLKHIERKLIASKCELYTTDSSLQPSLDLSDTLGSLAHLEDHLFEEASQFLTATETYILVQRLKGSSNGTEYKPLLSDLEKRYSSYQLNYELVDGRQRHRLLVRAESNRRQSMPAASRESNIKGQRRSSRVPRPKISQ